MIKFIKAATLSPWVNGSVVPFLLTHLSSTFTLTASSTFPLLVTCNVFSVSSPGNQLSGDVNFSIYVVPYSDVWNSFSNVVVLEKYATVNPTTPIIATNSKIIILLFF